MNPTPHLLRMEHNWRHVVDMAAKCIHFPSLIQFQRWSKKYWVWFENNDTKYLGVVHSPQLDLSVVRSWFQIEINRKLWLHQQRLVSTWYYQGKGRVKRSPIHSTIMSFQKILYYCIVPSEQIRADCLQPPNLARPGFSSHHNDCKCTKLPTRREDSPMNQAFSSSDRRYPKLEQSKLPKIPN